VDPHGPDASLLAGACPAPAPAPVGLDEPDAGSRAEEGIFLLTACEWLNWRHVYGCLVVDSRKRACSVWGTPVYSAFG
jgi:hypothetical protein